MNMDDIIPTVLVFIIVLFSVWLFSAMIVGFSVEAKCLELGYPKATINWKLDGYCINIEGSVQGVVKKL